MSLKSAGGDYYEVHKLVDNRWVLSAEYADRVEADNWAVDLMRRDFEVKIRLIERRLA